MPARCDSCGTTELVHVCPACRRKAKAEAKPKARRSAIRRCQPCTAFQIDPSTKRMRILPKCEPCLKERGITLEG
jgi:hypothetical protein